MSDPLTTAKNLEKQAFHIMDIRLRPKKISVHLNDLIDVCQALETASKGDYENLIYHIGILQEENKGLNRMLVDVAAKLDPDSEAWELCHAHYDEKYRVDPEKVIEKINNGEYRDII